MNLHFEFNNTKAVRRKQGVLYFFFGAAFVFLLCVRLRHSAVPPLTRFPGLRFTPDLKKNMEPKDGRLSNPEIYRIVGKDASVFSGESLPILYGNIRYYNTKIWGYFFLKKGVNFIDILSIFVYSYNRRRMLKCHSCF